ncbi:hypothetical protein L9F63_003925, partial [Diploptera punctata]
RIPLRQKGFRKIKDLYKYFCIYSYIDIDIESVWGLALGNAQKKNSPISSSLFNGSDSRFIIQLINVLSLNTSALFSVSISTL